MTSEKKRTKLPKLGSWGGGLGKENVFFPLTPSLNNLQSPASSSSSSSILRTDLSKSSSLLFGLEDRSCAGEVDYSKDIIYVSSLQKAMSLTSLLITFRSFHCRSKAVAKGRPLSWTVEDNLLAIRIGSQLSGFNNFFKAAIT